MGPEPHGLNGQVNKLGEQKLLRRSILAVHNQPTPPVDLDSSRAVNTKTGVAGQLELENEIEIIHVDLSAGIS
jgi:hypothetical protein